MFVTLITFLINLYFYKILALIQLVFCCICGTNVYASHIVLKNIFYKKKIPLLYRLSYVYIFTWKPIFKKNMYIGYLSELIVWKH